MSEDLNKKIKQLADLLAQENMQDNLKGLLSLLASKSTGADDDSSSKASNSRDPVESKEEKPARSDTEDNIDMLRKAKVIMDRLNNVNDPRINLLMAIKPFLSSRRQKKLSGCLNIIRMSNLVRLMEENEKGAFD
ncbi:MAG TPA: hypothetical protein GXX36_06930 [Clostridiaceae bacterium]|nr:hypothetical protein [Clostridiaceae bacterium]